MSRFWCMPEFCCDSSEGILKWGDFMNKSDFIKKLAEKTGFTQKDAEKFFNANNETIMEALSEGEKIQVVGFGSYEVRDRKAREGRDPRTGAAVSIPAKKVPVFKPGKLFRERVEG